MFLKELEKVLNEASKKAGYEDVLKVIVSNRKELCDYQSDDSFKLSKKYSKNPLTIAEEIVDKLYETENFDDYFTSIEAIRPGFINLIVSDKFINKNLNKMNESENFNIEKPYKEELFFLDYGGPNVAKPLHVGHLRPAIIGESLKRIISFKGHKTIGDVHLGDFGLQIGQVIYGVLTDNLKAEDITLDYLETTYPKMSALCKENEEVYEKCKTITKEVQEHKKEYEEIWNKIYKTSVSDIKRIYDFLGVTFDLWLGESDSYPYIFKLEEFLKDKNVLEESNGAQIISVKEETDNREVPPFMFKSSNGAYLYSTTDLATIYERVLNYKPDHIIYVVDERQQLHFEQVFRASRKSGVIKNEELKHAWFGTMNGPDGKPFKTRNGDLLKLDLLFKEVKENFLKLKEENKDMSEEDINKIVNAIIKYADLQNNRERNYIFDIAKFSEVIGKTGPYILYTYLRINKIIEKEYIGTLNEEIYNEIDRNLRIKLMELELSVNSAFNEKMPHYIADYVYDLCVYANTFYQNNRLSNLEDESLKKEWITLLNLSNKVLKKMLDLLIIEIPSKM